MVGAGCRGEHTSFVRRCSSAMYLIAVAAGDRDVVATSEEAIEEVAEEASDPVKDEGDEKRPDSAVCERTGVKVTMLEDGHCVVVGSIL